MWAPGDAGHWPVRPLGAEPWVSGVTGAECMGCEGISEQPQAGLALPPASRPSSGQSSASTPQLAPASQARPLDTPPTGSGRGRPKASRDLLGCLFLNAVLPLLLRLTFSSCPRSGSPPGLVLRHSPWLPPAGQPSPGRAVLSPSALPPLPSAQTPPPGLCLPCLWPSSLP